jgi:hypothetical protein
MRRNIKDQRSTKAAGGQSAGAKKLVLQRETLRELTSRELRAAEGGVDPCSSSRDENTFI